MSDRCVTEAVQIKTSHRRWWLLLPVLRVSTTLAAPLCVFVSHLLALGSVTLPLILVLFVFISCDLLHFLPFFRSFFFHTCEIAGRADASQSSVWRLKLARTFSRTKRGTSTTGVTSLIPFFLLFRLPAKCQQNRFCSCVQNILALCTFLCRRRPCQDRGGILMHCWQTWYRAFASWMKLPFNKVSNYLTSGSQQGVISMTPAACRSLGSALTPVTPVLFASTAASSCRRHERKPGGESHRPVHICDRHERQQARVPEPGVQRLCGRRLQTR